MALIDRCLAIMTAGVALASTLPLFANAWWVFDLFSHFRLQYLLLLTVLFVLHALRRRWKWALAVIPFATISAHPVVDNWPVSDPQDTASPRLSIMNVNVQAGNANVAPLLERLRHDLPDLVLVVEYDATWQRALGALADLYPHRIEAPRPDRFGIALLSRLPFSERETFDLLTTNAISARINFAGQSVSLLGVHLRPPVSTGWAVTRNQQLIEIGKLIADRSEPIVIIGDFNQTTYSPAFADWLADNQLRSAALASGLTFSWPTFLPLLGILIDHCVVSDDFIVNDFSRGPTFGSDHYPVTTTVSLRGAQ